MKLHQLKTEQSYFADAVNGKKNFEVRKNDRDFQVGDVLELIELLPPPGRLQKRITGKIARVQVSYILHGGKFGIAKGYCVIGLTRMQAWDLV